MSCANSLELYELRHFKKNSKHNKNQKKCMRIFYKNNPIQKIKMYTREFLIDVLNNNIENARENEYCNMKLLDHYNERLYESLIKEDDKDINKDVVIPILLMEEIKTDGGPRWIKGCLYDTDKNVFYLRSASNNKHIEDYKTLSNSLIRDWYVDDATMSTDYSFWNSLKEQIEKNPHNQNNKQ